MNKEKKEKRCENCEWFLADIEGLSHTDGSCLKYFPKEKYNVKVGNFCKDFKIKQILGK